MSLSALLRNVLRIACASPGVAQELADAVDAKPDLAGNNTLSGNNTFTGTNTHSGTETFTGAEHVGRVVGDQGTAHAAGGTDWALSAGFGSTASVAVATGSNDSRGKITITSAGTGQGANPTATLTFKDGAFGAAPVAAVTRGGGSQLSVPVTIVSISTTQMVLKFVGTPVAADTYDVYYQVEG